ncbi:MAG TPA: hypothetical protein VFG52_10815 [Xanthomonadales bacterium]|nr:hypothetical protein [Xanthomonadales bacterium]
MKYLAMRTILSAFVVLLLAASFNLAADDAKKPSYSNKWRIECSGKAHSDGTIVIKLSPKEGEPITIEVPVANKTSENDVAKTLVKGLQAKLDKKAYHVERDDGEDVLVKKKGKSTNFGLEIVSNDVEHVRIHVEKE